MVGATGVVCAATGKRKLVSDNSIRLTFASIAYKVRVSDTVENRINISQTTKDYQNCLVPKLLNNNIRRSSDLDPYVI